MARALMAVMVAVLTLVPGVAGAASNDDPAARRDQVRKDRAAVAAKVDVLRASDAEVQKALADLDANLGAQQAVVATAQQAAAVADQQLAEALDAERRKADELAAIKAKMAGIAVESYMSPLKGSFVTMLKSESLNDASMRHEFLDISANHGAEVTRQLKTAKADLEDQRKAAQAAQRAAGARRSEVEQRLASLGQAAGQQRQVATQVEGRIESGLAESAALSAVDTQLSDQIAARQAALAAQLKAASAAAAQARVVTRAPDAPAAADPVAVPSGRVGLTTVGGITVASSIAAQLGSLLAAAQADGISLGGSGYRDSSSQVALRQANGCPDVYTAPASSCRVPTARPGSSMHEQGLAIDFSSGGGLLTRGSPAFQWLSANAARFGFFNYPPEPWHWSTTGN
ncbi:MAG: D-alanyl-D-alanine carboxypeptidase family protein [Acidimicrobiales bacterium]